MSKIMDTIGKMIVGAATAIIVLTVVAVSLPSEAPVTASDSVAVPTVAPDRSHHSTERAPFYRLNVEDTDDDFDADGNPITPMGWAITMLYEEHGAIGAVNDCCDALYARIGSVVDFGTGTATVTIGGLAICMDGESGRCSGSEYLTDAWLGY